MAASAAASIRLIITGVAITRTFPLPMLGAVCSSPTTSDALPRSPVTTLPSSMHSMVTVQCGPMRCLLLILLSACAGLAQAWPTKPVTFIVPYPPGGGTDIIARIVQEPLSKQLGQTLIIENTGGAGGSTGTAVAAKAAPDGHTLLFTLSSHTINPAIYRNLSFDTERDFSAVSQVASLPQLFAVHPGTPYQSFRDIVAFMKANPGKINYGSVGVGSPSHMAGELLKLQLDVDM